MSNRTESNGRANPEVNEKPVRRHFDAAYKLRILEEADRCSEVGKVGELLRREGLYSSHLTNWRHLRDEGTLQSLGPKRRGRKAKCNDATTQELDRLRRDNQGLAERLRQAETIIEVQKKVSEILGLTPTNQSESNEEKH
jgi:transposase-like protein